MVPCRTLLLLARSCQFGLRRVVRIRDAVTGIKFIAEKAEDVAVKRSRGLETIDDERLSENQARPMAADSLSVACTDDSRAINTTARSSRVCCATQSAGSRIIP